MTNPRAESRLEAIVRYNPRVLAAPLKTFAAEALDPVPDRIAWILPLALDRIAEPLLLRAKIPFESGAGGLIARIGPAERKALENSSSGGAELAGAIWAAIAGWSRNRYEWLLKDGRALSLGGLPLIMGVLNATPDSFSDGGLHFFRQAAIGRIRDLVEAGADLLDLGGESTRPGAGSVSAQEEMDRVLPLVEYAVQRFEVPLSIDTTKAEVARAALDKGASIINDISALAFDPDMAPLAARSGAGLVLMHLRGRPADMQKNPFFHDAPAEVCRELGERALAAIAAGVDRRRIVLDPGIGFGKRFEDNLALIAHAGELRSLGFPLLFGCSRKSFLGRITGREAPDRALETAASSLLAAQAGVSILRVHDVEENRRALLVARAVLGARRSFCDCPAELEEKGD